jgi:hypothetical protein
MQLDNSEFRETVSNSVSRACHSIANSICDIVSRDNLTTNSHGLDRPCISLPSRLHSHSRFFIPEPEIRSDGIVGPQEITLFHLGGKLRITFFTLIFRNIQSWTSKTAKGCKLILLLPEAETLETRKAYPAYWMNERISRGSYQLDQGIDTTSPEIERLVMDALLQIEFCKEETQTYKGSHAYAFVAFGLEINGKPYLATNPPGPLLPTATASGTPFQFFTLRIVMEGEEISPVQSPLLAIIPGNWKDFRLTFLERRRFDWLRRLWS